MINLSKLNGHRPYRSLSLKIFEDEMNEVREITDGGNLPEKKIKLKRDLE